MTYVWISDDGPSPDDPGQYFNLAFDIRQALQESGWDARIFSVSRRLESLFSPDDEHVVFPLAEFYPYAGHDGYGLRKEVEAMGIPHVGSSYSVVSQASNKQYAKETMSKNGIMVPSGIVIENKNSLQEKISQYLDIFSVPAVVKPLVWSGGSQGVIFVSSAVNLRSIAEKVLLATSTPILIEQYIPGIEVSVWVLGVGPETEWHSVLIVDRQGQPIYDRDLKTGQAWLNQLGNNRQPRLVTDHYALSEREIELAGETASRAHRAINAYSYSRVDLILAKNGAVVLEINVHPNLGCKGQLSITKNSSKTYADLMSLLVSHAQFHNY